MATAVLTLFDGLTGVEIPVAASPDATLGEIRGLVSARTHTLAKLLVFLCDGQPPSQACTLQQLVAVGKPVYVYDRSVIAKAVDNALPWPHEHKPVPPVVVADWAPLDPQKARALAEQVVANSKERVAAVGECVQQQHRQLDALRMALRNLNSTMRRDAASYRAFDDTCARLEAQMELLFPEFSSSILPAMRQVPLHPAHANQCRATTLGELFGEDPERKSFQQHNQARLEWQQRKEQLRRLHDDTYVRSKQVLERGKAVAVSVDACVHDAQRALGHALGLLKGGQDVDVDAMERLDCESATVLNRCRSAQSQLHVVCSRVLHDVVQLQSHVRQLDIRRAAHTHVSVRLHEFTAHLKMLQRLPRMYADCLDEIAARRGYEAKLGEIAEQFTQKQQELLRTEETRRHQFDEQVPRDVQARLFPALHHPPFKFDVSAQRIGSGLPPVPHHTTAPHANPDHPPSQQPLVEVDALKAALREAKLALGDLEMQASKADWDNKVLSKQHSDLATQHAQLTERFATTLAVEREKRAKLEAREKVLREQLEDSKLSMANSLLEQSQIASAASQERIVALQANLEAKSARVAALEGELQSLQPMLDAVQSMLDNAQHHEFELLGYRTLAESAHKFLEQLTQFAGEVGVDVPLSLVRSEMPDFDDAFKVVQRMVATGAHRPASSPRPRPCPLMFPEADIVPRSVVVFHRASTGSPFVALSKSSSHVTVLGSESVEHVKDCIDDSTTFIVGRVVETALVQSPHQDGAERVLSVTAEVLQIDNRVLGQ